MKNKKSLREKQGKILINRGGKRNISARNESRERGEYNLSSKWESIKYQTDSRVLAS